MLLKNRFRILGMSTVSCFIVTVYNHRLATDSPSDRSVFNMVVTPSVGYTLPAPRPTSPSLNFRPLPPYSLPPSLPSRCPYIVRGFLRGARTPEPMIVPRLGCMATSAAAHRALRSVVTHPQKPRLSTMHLPHTRAIQQSNSPAGAILKQRGAFVQRWYM